MNYTHDQMAALLLRVALGSIMIAHSLYLKMVVFSLAGTSQYFESIGLPGALAYLVFVIEAIAGGALILGFKTRFFSILLVPVLLGATWAHGSNGWLFTNANGGWEYPLFLAIAALTQALLGDGAYGISSTRRLIPA